MRNKRLSDEYKLARGCSICGYNRSSRALHFHHPDPTKKNAMIRGYAHLKTGKLADERAKCVLLCANCHYEQHDMFA